ncbi:MAG TPA: SAF domain-containing protein [bacterium]|nr:SAF domain-containing protein [bacterium]
MDSTVRSLWHVRLISPGDHPRLSIAVLMRHAGITLSEAQKRSENPPVVVYSTPDHKKAVALVREMEQSGAVLDYYRDAEPETPYSEISVDTQDTGRGENQGEELNRRRFPWIVLILALLPVVINGFQKISDNLGDLKAIKDALASVWSGGEEPFKQVRVIVAAREIEPGETIGIDDVKVVSVSRDTVPENAVAPLNVDRLLGKQVTRRISRGQILVWDPCGASDSFP